MSRADEIRSALRQSAEPMFPREVCDALGAEDRRERTLVSASLAAAASQGAGIEKLHDGRYSLIPGWKKGSSQQDPAETPVPEGAPEMTPASLADITHVEIPEGAISVEEIEQLMAQPGGGFVVIPTAGTAASTNKIARKILEHLQGDADYDVLSLLRDAREEIMQLECAARFALDAAGQLTARLKAATT